MQESFRRRNRSAAASLSQIENALAAHLRPFSAIWIWEAGLQNAAAGEGWMKRA